MTAPALGIGMKSPQRGTSEYLQWKARPHRVTPKKIKFYLKSRQHL